MRIYQNDEDLINPDYLKEQILSRSKNDFDGLQIRIFDHGIINMLGNGYGSWKIRLDITLCGGGVSGIRKEKEYYYSHNNEDWFLSKKNRSSADNDNDREAADRALQATYEAVIDYNIERIIWDIESFIDDLKEGE